jgi:transcriptional regulator with XRE-family HTH domain
MGSITGDRLRALRLEHELSQEEVAKKIGISRPAYVNYENGKSRPVRKLKELSDLFNVTTDYIMGLSDNPHGEGFAGQDGKHFLLFAGQQEQEQEPRYYHDPEVAEMANQLKDNPDMRVLFDASRDLKKESIEEVVKFIQYQKAKERGEF